MRHSEVVYLLDVTITEDELGNQIESSTERMVYANEMSVSATEFYGASATNLKVSKMFEIYSFEYQNEIQLRHDGLIYSVKRPDKRGDKIRITCERSVGNG